MVLVPIGDYVYNNKHGIQQRGFGTVFKGSHRNNPSELVTVKVIKKAGMISELLEKEITRLRELTTPHHPNVVNIYDYIEKNDCVYVIMEYCNGGDLASYLQGNSIQSEDNIKLFLRQIADGLSVLYGKGIAHCDIKPHNIFLKHQGPELRKPQTSDITLKIVYVGNLRCLIRGNMAGSGNGASAYMAPEAMLGLKCDIKADLWSLGITLYQCLTGKFPFKAMATHGLEKLYEKNANLQLTIPACTSEKMKDLLISLLKLNPSFRMTLEELYQHPFVRRSKRNTKDRGRPAVVQCIIQWVQASNGNVPAGAVVGGQDRSEGPVFVARALHERAILPGKLIPTHGCAYVPWGGREHKKNCYQILVAGPLKWVQVNGSPVPPGAIAAGKTEKGEPLHIGRVNYKQNIITGKVQPSHGMCYIPYKGKEIAFADYEVLTS